MLKQITIATLMYCLLTPASWAQGSDLSDQSAGFSGAQKRGTHRTDPQAEQGWTQNLAPAFPGQTHPTGPGSRSAGDINGSWLPQARTTQYGVAPGVTVDLHRLPPTRLDSFVRNAPNAEAIYGDEGTEGPPPLNGFNFGNTIGSGIVQPGLSTGHASVLPSAWLDTAGRAGGGIPSGEYQAPPLVDPRFFPGGQFQPGQVIERVLPGVFPGGQFPDSGF